MIFDFLDFANVIAPFRIFFRYNLPSPAVHFALNGSFVYKAKFYQDT